MSYIRTLSNPERLYVWGERDGNIYWTWKNGHTTCTRKDFDGLMKAFKKARQELPISYGELSLEEIPSKPIDFKKLALGIVPRRNHNAYRYKLTFSDGSKLLMWRVTFVYVF